MKRILFVDDDRAELERLENALTSPSQEWQLAFASSGAEALALMEKAAADVVVADMHMPAMTGAQLLNAIGKAYPKTVRFILASQADKDLIMKCVLGSHQFLAKPCEPEHLKTAIQRALALDIWLTNDHIKDLVARIRTFPSIPSLYFEVLKELRSPDVSTEKVGTIIARDLAMTTKILQMLNSAYFGLSRQITDLTEAVGLLGHETIKSLVLSIQVFSQYDKIKPIYFSIDRLWKHSTVIASAARKMAQDQKEDRALAEAAFTAGLLHDIGKLVLAANFEEQYHGAQALARKTNMPLWEVERDLFGGSHAEIGAYLLGLWGLPMELLEAAALHHDPQRAFAKTFSPLTAVHVANVLEYELHPEGEGLVSPQLDHAYLAELGLTGQLDRWRVLVTGQTPAPKSPVAPAPAAQNRPAPVTPDEPKSETRPWYWSLRPYAVPMVLLGLLIVMSLVFWPRERPRSAPPKPSITTSSEPGPSPIAVSQPATPPTALGAPETNTTEPTPSASSEPKATATNAPVPQPVSDTTSPIAAASEPEFPLLRLQGINYSRTRPSVLINGRILHVGDLVDGVRVVSIKPQIVVVAKNGQTRRLIMR